MKAMTNTLQSCLLCKESNSNVTNPGYITSSVHGMVVMGDDYTYFFCSGYLGVTTSEWPASAYVVKRRNARTKAVLFTHGNNVNNVSEVVHKDQTTTVQTKHTVEAPTKTHTNDSPRYRAVTACSSLLDWAANRTQERHVHASLEQAATSARQLSPAGA